ncbi:bifunctional tryptophan synthase trp1 [Rhizophlyctis rosea]|nr:bifunctional tryptophan synthase trp1 [Rhizophlyctis rosea]
MTTLLIDNYDSFTWNVYQYLSDLGAEVEVFRNDQVTLEECIALKPRNIVISPGPGRPADAGVSNDVLRHFAGKVPILGVCLGEQCMYEVFGGTVTYAGEIVHGKTSPVKHDGRGLYETVPQRIETTRYHSLAGDPATLPDCLEITSWTDSGVVMGVRHKEFIMEGVQYHPESVASEYGKVMFANFLRWEGGKWSDLKVNDKWVRPLDDNEKGGGPGEGASAGNKRGAPTGSGIPLSKVSKMNSTATPGGVAANGANGEASGDAPKGPTILERIRDQRLIDVAEARALPGRSDWHLQRSIATGVPLPNIDFPARLKPDGQSVAVMAEIKRASPSKGNIDISAHAPTQALHYAHGGASVISVLTEPKWFKGSLEDMRQVRAALDGLPNRPAVLRKDFIIDRYQILEARVYGADTLLLIVAILTDEELIDLLQYSRELGMEPMVEVANAEEMRRAVAVGSKVIGVNNRDLHTFNVDMNRTSDLASMVPPGTILAALSGITSRADVEKYISGGAEAVLVGEALMRTSDKRAFIQNLLGKGEAPTTTQQLVSNNTLAKICGVKRVEDGLFAAKEGADFIGLIFAKSPRQVTVEQAKEVVRAVRGAFGEDVPTAYHPPFELPVPDGTTQASAWFAKTLDAIRALRNGRRSPLFTGVFSGHSVAEINQIVREVGLDLVQFHGDEAPELARLVRVPVVKAFHVHSGESAKEVLSRVEGARGTIAVPLLDTGIKGLAQQGGSGETFDWGVATGLKESGGVGVMMAGGLTGENVRSAVEKVRPWCVDVSSGVEVDGQKGVKDHGKVKAFLEGVREANAGVHTVTEDGQDKTYTRTPPFDLHRTLTTKVGPRPLVLTATGRPAKHQPPPVLDQPSGYYPAQVLLYGLKAAKNVEDAKKTLFAAFAKSSGVVPRLEVPKKVVALEERLKASFLAENEAARARFEMERKKGGKRKREEGEGAGSNTEEKATKIAKGTTTSVKNVASTEPAAKSPVVKSPVVKSPVVKSPAAKSPVVKSPVVKSPVVKSPAAKSSAAKSPAPKKAAAVPSAVLHSQDESSKPAPRGRTKQTARKTTGPRALPNAHRIDYNEVDSDEEVGPSYDAPSSPPPPYSAMPVEEVASVEVNCNCSVPASHFQSRKENENKGRWFWTCGNKRSCKFFQWDAPVENIGSDAHVMGGTVGENIRGEDGDGRDHASSGSEAGTAKSKGGLADIWPTIPVLKEACRRRGLNVGGTKG